MENKQEVEKKSGGKRYVGRKKVGRHDYGLKLRLTKLCLEEGIPVTVVAREAHL